MPCLRLVARLWRAGLGPSAPNSGGHGREARARASRSSVDPLSPLRKPGASARGSGCVVATGRSLAPGVDSQIGVWAAGPAAFAAVARARVWRPRDKKATARGAGSATPSHWARPLDQPDRRQGIQFGGEGLPGARGPSIDADWWGVRARALQPEPGLPRAGASLGPSHQGQRMRFARCQRRTAATQRSRAFCCSEGDARRGV